MADKLFEEASRDLNVIGGTEETISLSRVPDYIVIDLVGGDVTFLENARLSQGEEIVWDDITDGSFVGGITLDGNTVTCGYYSGGAYVPTLTIKAYYIEPELVWEEPVYNRTQADVDFALRKIAEWKATGGRTAYDLKGCFNLSDLNRIENNLAYLSETLTKYGYSPSLTTKKWVGNELPTEEDIKRILRGVESLVQSFYKDEDAPNIPSSLRTYEEVNAVEKNLYFIKLLMNVMENCFKESNTFQSGSTVYLPIKRR